MDELKAVISTVHWDRISSIQGDCSNVPHAIDLLLSDDPQVRQSAYRMLDNHVVVQGGLFEGAFYVIPFLLQISLVEVRKGRFEAMNLLFEIAAGASSFNDRVCYSVIPTPFVHYKPNSSAVGVPLAIAVRFAVACGLPDITPCMAFEDADERKSVRQLLSLFPEYAGGLSEQLRSIAATSNNHGVCQDIYQLINEMGA